MFKAFKFKTKQNKFAQKQSDGFGAIVIIFEKTAIIHCWTDMFFVT